jgi:hypothetical protein
MTHSHLQSQPIRRDRPGRVRKVQPLRCLSLFKMVQIPDDFYASHHRASTVSYGIARSDLHYDRGHLYLNNY